jgi:hypothetical protein
MLMLRVGVGGGLHRRGLGGGGEGRGDQCHHLKSPEFE